MSALRVETISDHAAFQSLRPLWNEVLERSDTVVPFLTHEWLATWWECFAGDATMLVLLVRRGSEPVALAPLMIGARGRITFWANAHSMRANFLLAEQPCEALRAIFAHLAAGGIKWRDLMLNYIPEDSAAGRLVAEVCREVGLRFGFLPSLVSPYISLAGLDWESYRRQLRHGFRVNLGRRQRRWFGREGGSVSLYRSPDSVADALEACRTVSLDTWQHEHGSSIASTPQLWRFYTAIARLAAERGWLRIGVLRARGEPVAFEFNLFHRGVMYNLKVGFRAQWRSFGPGHVLKAHIIEQALREGATEFDLLGINEAYKMEWATGVRAHTCLCAAGRSAAALLDHWLHFRAKAWLRRWPPAAAAKRWWQERKQHWSRPEEQVH